MQSSISRDDVSLLDAPPFQIADNVMDLNNLKNLGLQTMESRMTPVYQAEPGGSFSHHSGMIVFKDRLYCSWSGGKEVEDGSGQWIYYRSTTDGEDWSDLRILAKPPGGDRFVSAGFHATPNMLVAYFTHAKEGVHNLRHPDTALCAVTSEDGEHWSEPKRLIDGFFIEGPLRLPSGRLLMGGEHVEFDQHQTRMRLIYTDQPDGLSDWKVAEIHPELSQPKGLRIFDYTECCPFVRADGTVVAPFRNYSGHLYASTSRDEGKSWSVPVETNFPDSMARFSTGTLPDGQTWLINNPGPGRNNRSFLTLALSRDGILFDRAWLLHGEPTSMRFPGKDKTNGWQYPHARVWKDHLFISYSVNKEDVMVSRIPLKALSL